MGREEDELAQLQGELDAAQAALREANAHLQVALANYRRSKTNDEAKAQVRATALLGSAATERYQRALKAYRAYFRDSH